MSNFADINKAIASTRRKWEKILCSPRQASVRAIRPAINYMYEDMLRKRAPEIIRVSSPAALSNFFNMNCSADMALSNTLSLMARTRLDDNCRHPRIELTSDTREKLSSLHARISSLFLQQMAAVKFSLYTYYSRQSVGKAAMYEAIYKGHKFLLRPEPESSMRASLCKHAFTWFPCENRAIVCDNPEAKYDASGRLHCEDGPALKFDRSTRYFFWHGIIVPEQVILFPESQTVQEIHDESNVEIRRIRIERLGWLNYLRKINAKTRDKRKNEIEGTNEALMESLDGKVLVCACPSTGRVYALQVPFEIKTCRQAQVWLSGGLSKRVTTAT